MNSALLSIHSRGMLRPRLITHRWLSRSALTRATCAARPKNIGRKLGLHREGSSAAAPRPMESSAVAPQPSIDKKSIRLHPERHMKNCQARHYRGLEDLPLKISEDHAEWLENERKLAEKRSRLNEIHKSLSSQKDMTPSQRAAYIQEARKLKDLPEVMRQAKLKNHIEAMAVQLPNLMSSHTPTSEAKVLEIKEPRQELCGHSGVRDHVKIGQELKILDFSSAATTSGWGFYFLLNEAERLEQALVQYAKSVAHSYDYLPCSPPSLVYTDLGSACGFRPRDSHGEQQVYNVQQDAEAIKSRKPGLSLAGTAEIPFAAMQTNSMMQATDLPRRLVGSSRCYRAEAGARGKEARGLYRVHEFTKVEMFAWTLPGRETDVFDEMINIQREIISNLGLPFRRLEMPASDLGASAFRKQDIEVWFPSRGRAHETHVKGNHTQVKNGDSQVKGSEESEDTGGGWGEVTSTSICTDYQTRRLNTLVELPPNAKHKTQYPSTVNGTAMAVPRILAALLECGWNAEDEAVHLPPCLWPYMNGQNMIRKPKTETKQSS